MVGLSSRTIAVNCFFQVRKILCRADNNNLPSYLFFNCLYLFVSPRMYVCTFVCTYVCVQLVILLYLFDNETSWMILFSSLIGKHMPTVCLMMSPVFVSSLLHAVNGVHFLFCFVVISIVVTLAALRRAVD